MPNRMTIDVSVAGGNQAQSALGGVAKSLLSVAAAFAAVRKGVEVIREATTAAREWESGMANANRMLGVSERELKRLQMQLLNVQGPLQYVTDLYDVLPDALYAAASAGQDASNMMGDMSAIAALAASSHIALDDATTRVMRSLRAFSYENGQAAIVTGVLVGAEQKAIATADELSAALPELGAAFAVTNESIYTTASALAATTQAGFTANKASTALRTGWARLQTETVQAKLEALGVEVTDFASTMEAIGEAGLEEQDWVEIFGARHYPKFVGLIEKWDVFNETIEATKTADVGAMFEDYARTAAAAADKMENELRAEMIKLGEDIQPVMLQLEKFGLEAKKIFAELAVGIVKNWETAAAAASGFLVVLNLIKGHPLVAAAAGVVAGIMLLINATKDANIALRDQVREQRDALVERRATIDALREEVKAQKAAAEAAGENAERIAHLADQYRDLTEASSELAVQELELGKTEAGLTAAIEAREAAIEIGGGGRDRRAEGELYRELQALQEQTRTREDALELQQRLVALQTDVNTAAALGEEEKIRSSIVGFMVDTLGMTKEQAEITAENKIDIEETGTLFRAIDAIIENTNTKLANEAAIIDETVKLEYDRLDIAEGMALAQEKRLDMSEAELQTMERALRIELAVLEAQTDVLNRYAAQAREGGDIGLARAVVESGRVLEARIEALQAATGAFQAASAASAMGTSDEAEAIGGGLGGAAAERVVEYARNSAQKALENTALAWYLRFVEQTDRGWEKFVDHGKAAVASVGEELVSKDRWTQVAEDLGGLLDGVLTDSAYSFGDALKTAGLEAIEALLIYIAASELSSLLGGGDVAKPGGFAGLFADLLGFAEGGYVTKPTMAMIGEGGEPEWVIPRSMLEGALSDGGLYGMAQMFQRLSGQPVSAAPARAATTNVYNSYGLAVGSLDRMDVYQRRATARMNRRAYS